MNTDNAVKRFATYRKTIGRAAAITRITSLLFIIPTGIIVGNTGVVLAGLTLYTLGMEARNLYERLRPDNMLDSVMHNMGDLFND